MATSLSAPGTHSEQAERLRSLFAEISRELAVNRAALVEYSVLAPYHRIVVRPQRVVVPVVAQVEARPPVALVLLAGEQRLRRARRVDGDAPLLRVGDRGDLELAAPLGRALDERAVPLEPARRQRARRRPVLLRLQVRQKVGRVRANVVGGGAAAVGEVGGLQRP